MKKFKIMLATVFAATTLTGCRTLPHTKYSKVHIIAINRCREIADLKEYSKGIEVYVNEYGWIYLPDGEYYLVKDKCPLCDR